MILTPTRPLEKFRDQYATCDLCGQVITRTQARGATTLPTHLHCSEDDPE